MAGKNGVADGVAFAGTVVSGDSVSPIELFVQAARVSESNSRLRGNRPISDVLDTVAALCHAAMGITRCCAFTCNHSQILQLAATFIILYSQVLSTI